LGNIYSTREKGFLSELGWASDNPKVYFTFTYSATLWTVVFGGLFLVDVVILLEFHHSCLDSVFSPLEKYPFVQ
jgi:hypothetical protein